MAEYIDRDHYCRYICRCNGDICDKTKCPLFTAPTADVAPVVHGEWVFEDHDEYGKLYKCSACGRGIVLIEECELPNYCPLCGAKVDGGEHNV